MGKLIKIVEVVTAEVKKDLSVYQMAFLCHLSAAAPDPVSYQDMARKVGVSIAAVSRNAKLLGQDMKKVEGKWADKGLGLVEAGPNPYNSREFVITLSAKGKKLMEKVDKMLA
jgi:DNA-binding MarR family transcriptional regulator